MGSPKSLERIFLELVAKLGPRLRDTFLRAIHDLRNGIDWAGLVDALRRGNIEEAVEALNIEYAVFQSYAAIKTEVVVTAAAATGRSINVGGTVRFDLSNPTAEVWIKENVGNWIQEDFVNKQKETVREVIRTGYARGEGPNSIARDIAGRVQGGQRVGGVLGLDGPRAERLLKVKNGMKSADGIRSLVEIDKNGNARVRYKVNRQTEQRILKAHREGRAMTAAEQKTAQQQYENKLLKERGETVARTETGQAVMGGRQLQWEQLEASGKIKGSQVIKTWIHGSSSQHYRKDHREMNGKSVVGLHTMFDMPDGVRKMHALDGRGGAKQDVNCGCSTTYRISHKVE